ncbi:hypothetical protein, partial [Staphylococcus epidermidis]|uniref:hypothetical protein n=1 Tax=Staphylococcus epidermidis TaxID=1282 RepID=UPI001C930290
LPSIKLSTGRKGSKKYVSDGKIKGKTFGTVGEKGRGNGGSGFRDEMIEYGKGKRSIRGNRDRSRLLGKGCKVYNGRESDGMVWEMGGFSTG